MVLEMIYTFHDREQVFIKTPLDEGVMTSKITLMHEAMKHLKKVERANLIKISCCVYDTKNKKLPEWYHNMNGKFWLDDIEGYRYVNDIKSTVPKDYIIDWMLQNSSNLVLDWV